jgi:phytoene dehydrogenase-like protein
MSRPDVLIGAGLSGLSCVLWLHEGGFSFLGLEASDGIGGRVRTYELEGLLLDRGFQVFLMAYSEARQVLDYGALDFKPFYSGPPRQLSERKEPRREVWR